MCGTRSTAGLQGSAGCAVPGLLCGLEFSQITELVTWLSAQGSAGALATYPFSLPPGPRVSPRSESSSCSFSLPPGPRHREAHSPRIRDSSSSRGRTSRPRLGKRGVANGAGLAVSRPRGRRQGPAQSRKGWIGGGRTSCTLESGPCAVSCPTGSVLDREAGQGRQVSQGLTSRPLTNLSASQGPTDLSAPD
jgi:hypothetical protein